MGHTLVMEDGLIPVKIIYTFYPAKLASGCNFVIKQWQNMQYRWNSLKITDIMQKFYRHNSEILMT